MFKKKKTKKPFWRKSNKSRTKKYSLKSTQRKASTERKVQGRLAIKRRSSLILAKAKNKLGTRFWMLIVSLCGLIVILGFGYVALFTNSFTINTVILYEGDKLSDNPEFLQVAQTFRGDNLFLLSKRRVARQFIETGLPIRDVRVVKDLPSELRIAVEPVAPVYNLIVQKGKVEHKFVLNEAGYVIAVDEHREGLLYLRVESEDLPAYQDRYLSQEKTQEFADYVELYETGFNMNISELLYYPIARELHLYTDRDFTVWLDLEADIPEQLQKLKDSVEFLNIYEQPIDYIDLRIKGIDSEKVIYKLK